MIKLIIPSGHFILCNWTYVWLDHIDFFGFNVPIGQWELIQLSHKKKRER